VRGVVPYANPDAGFMDDQVRNGCMRSLNLDPHRPEAQDVRAIGTEIRNFEIPICCPGPEYVESAGIGLRTIVREDHALGRNAAHHDGPALGSTQIAAQRASI